MFPVQQEGKLIGCISSDRVKQIPRGEWDQRTVASSLDNCSAENSVASDTDAMKAFSLMGRTGKSRLMVVDQGRLVGIIALRDIMGYLLHTAGPGRGGGEEGGVNLNSLNGFNGLNRLNGFVQTV